MNLGKSELSLGLDFLRQRAEKGEIRFVSTNLISQSSQLWLNKYVTKDIGGLKVAILGVLPEDSLVGDDYTEFREDLQVISPIAAVRETVNSIKNQVDVIIILSQLNLIETTQLVAEVKEINLAVAHSDKTMCEMSLIPNQLVVPNSVRGQFYLSAGISINGNGSISVSQNEPIELSNEIAHNSVVDDIIISQSGLQREKHSASNQQMSHNPSPVPLTALTKEEFFIKINEERAKLKELRQKPQGEKISAKILFDGKEIPATIYRERKVDVQDTTVKPKDN